MKKTLLALTIAGLLTACGSSSNSSSSDDTNSSSTETTTASATEYRVIDGYLSNAEVCYLAEGATDCEVIGTTDDNGLITIPDGTDSGQLIATIIAGQTSDADGVGYVGTTYQMITDIGTGADAVITPYTTLDALDDTKSIDDIAADLGVSVDLVKGDYVSSTDEDQASVAIIAKTLVTQLSESVEENNASELLTQATEVKTYIDEELVNSDIDLSEQNVVVLDDGSLSTETAITELEDFLINENGLSVISLNAEYYSQEGGSVAMFSEDGTGSFSGEDNFTFTYSTEGDFLTTSVDSDSATDQFIYVNSTIALSVPLAGKDLTVMVDSTLETATSLWDRDEIVGNTLYLIFDDSSGTTVATPTYAALTFSDEEVVVIEDGETATFEWSLDDDGFLTLYTGNDYGDRDVTFVKYLTDDNIVVYNDYYNESFGLMLSDENLAEALFNEWSSISE